MKHIAEHQTIDDITNVIFHHYIMDHPEILRYIKNKKTRKKILSLFKIIDRYLEAITGIPNIATGEVENVEQQSNNLPAGE